MILHTHKPVFPLNRFVENLVYFDGPSTAHNLDRFLPDGNSEIIIDLTERPQYIYDNETLQAVQACRHAWVSGVRTHPITIPSGQGNRMVIVAFKRGKAFPFYRFPMRELTNRVVDADLVLGRLVTELRERLLALRSIKQIFPLVEAFLLQQAGKALEETVSTRCIDYALSSIIHQPTIQRLRELSEQIGYSHKHFISLFADQVGISPKQYLRIMRFQETICAIEKKKTIRWSEIARECGYYDQAHLTHDFRNFSGFTPNEYLKKKHPCLTTSPWIDVNFFQYAHLAAS
jgi:AraC-like DNA-binding protein